MRLVLAGLLASVVLLNSYAFAASFSSTSNGFGAESKIVASCGSGMAISYTASFDANVSGYAVNGVDLSNIPPGCLGKSLSVTFTTSSLDAEGDPITDTLPVSGSSQRIPIDPRSNTIAVSEISAVSLVVF